MKRKPTAAPPTPDEPAQISTAPARRRKATESKLSVRYRRLKALYKISDLINSTTNPATLLRRILAEAAREMKADSGSLAFVNTETQTLEIHTSVGMDTRRAGQLRLRVGQGVTGTVAATGKPVRLDDVHGSPMYVEVESHVRSELAVPLRVEGEVIGVLNVNSSTTGAFTEEDERLMMALGNQAAKVIHTARLYERVERQTRRLEGLFAVGQALISPDPLPMVLNRITQAVQEIMDVKLCSIMLLSDMRELTLSAVSGGSAQYTQRPALSVKDSLVGDVVTRRQPVQVFDVRRAKRYRARTMAREEHLVSLLSVPVFFTDSLIGILNIYTDQPRRFSDDDIRLLNAFASLCAIAIENAQRYERMLKAEHGIRQADRLATLGILSAEIAHEIRNPVTIISMLLHSLREDRAILPDRERDMDIILDKLDRINRIVSQVLNISRKRPQPLEWVDVNQVIEELLLLVNHAFAEHQVVLQKDLDPTLPAILADRGHFDQIFLNLMMNAQEAMPNGGILHIRSMRMPERGSEPDRIRVIFKDTGTGISSEVMSHLFTPFTSTRKEGVGLGLFVSQKLLKEYGGNITVKSAPDEGTSFRVEVPVEAPPA